jgi:hypothetical protein
MARAMERDKQDDIMRKRDLHRRPISFGWP